MRCYTLAAAQLYCGAYHKAVGCPGACRSHPPINYYGCGLVFAPPSARAQAQPERVADFGLDGEYLEPFCKAESEIGFRLSPLLPWAPAPTPAPAPAPTPASTPAPAPAPAPRRSPLSSDRFERRNPATFVQRSEPAPTSALVLRTSPLTASKPLSGCDRTLSGGERTPPWEARRARHFCFRNRQKHPAKLLRQLSPLDFFPPAAPSEFVYVHSQ